MTEDFLAQLVRDSAESFGVSDAGWRAEDSQTAEKVHFLEQYLAIWPPILPHLHRWAKKSWEQTASGKVEEANALMARIADVLDLVTDALSGLPEAIQKAVNLGYRVEGADIPDRVMTEVIQLRNELAHYPQFTKETFDEAQAAYAHGEFMEGLDAFAAMKGVKREEMERRLEEHKRKRNEWFR